MNPPPTGPSTRLSNIQTRGLRRYCTSSWCFTLMRRFETSSNVHVTSVVSLLNGRAPSKLFINHKNESPDMNLRHVFSEYVDFPILAPPITSYYGILIWVSERTCRFWNISMLYNTYAIYWSKTSVCTRNQGKSFPDTDLQYIKYFYHIWKMTAPPTTYQTLTK